MIIVRDGVTAARFELEMNDNGYVMLSSPLDTHSMLGMAEQPREMVNLNEFSFQRRVFSIQLGRETFEVEIRLAGNVRLTPPTSDRAVENPEREPVPFPALEPIP